MLLIFGLNDAKNSLKIYLKNLIKVADKNKAMSSRKEKT